MWVNFLVNMKWSVVIIDKEKCWPPQKNASPLARKYTYVPVRQQKFLLWSWPALDTVKEDKIYGQIKYILDLKKRYGDTIYSLYSVRPSFGDKRCAYKRGENMEAREEGEERTAAKNCQNKTILLLFAHLHRVKFDEMNKYCPLNRAYICICIVKCRDMKLISKLYLDILCSYHLWTHRNWSIGIWIFGLPSSQHLYSQILNLVLKSTQKIFFTKIAATIDGVSLLFLLYGTYK
jgi:hypothetical protein